MGQCPDGTFSWGLVRAAPTQFDPDLKNVSVSGTLANVQDNRGGLHTASVDVLDRDRTDHDHGQRARVDAQGALGTATATAAFDGNMLVDGAASFRFQAPFIRVDTEK